MLNEPQFKIDIVLDIAKQMAVAARTAPKARGVDNIEINIASDRDLIIIADKMEEIGKENNLPSFSRDADNIRNSEAVLLLGTRIKPIGLTLCGLCGMGTCANKEQYPDIPCAFNTSDLGIALGSAASCAMDHRIDNRIMYTIGMATRELGLFTEEIKIIFGIALSVSGKNIYFDRKQ